MSLKDKVKNSIQNQINARNRKMLRNLEPTLICSNCTGGFLYHWLGLRFCSPFINLYMTPQDFISMLEDFDNFMAHEIIEDMNSGEEYPVGIGLHGERIHFMHYSSFEEAIEKWKNRKERMNLENVGVMLTNFTGGAELLERFENLPFKHKVCFTSKDYSEYPHTFHIQGYNPKSGKNLYTTQSITGKRYIDQFDYVQFINHLDERKTI